MSAMLHILGATLATATEKEEIVCRGLLRLSIAEHTALNQQTDPAQLAAHIKTMTYADWVQVLSRQTLLERLSSLGVLQATQVLAHLKQTLIEKQSLLTIAAR